MFVERRGGNRWVPADPPVAVRRGYDDEDSWEPKNVYTRCGRNWQLANALADGEREGGLADMMDTIPPLPGHPRGLPADASPLVRDYALDLGGMIYRAGWMTVREVLELPWDAPYMYRAAYVPKEFAGLFDGTLVPGGVAGGPRAVRSALRRRGDRRPAARGNTLTSASLASGTAGG